MFVPTHSTPEELEGYPDNIRESILYGEAEAQKRWDRWMAGDDSYGTPTSLFFSLSYASWLLFPRLSLQEMPVEWQARFYALIEEGEKFGLTCPDGLEVSRRHKGRYADNSHWNNYRRGTVAQAQERDKALTYEE